MSNEVLTQAEAARMDLLISLVGTGQKVLNLGDQFDGVLNQKLKTNNHVTCLDYLRADITFNLEEGLPNNLGLFDAVVAGEIFEHIYKLNQLLLRIKRVIKPGGCLIVSVPNVCNLINRFKMLLGQLPSYCADADKYCPDYGGHIRDFNLAELTNLLTINGFKIISVKSQGLCFRGKILFKAPASLGTNLIIKAVTVN